MAADTEERLAADSTAAAAVADSMVVAVVGPTVGAAVTVVADIDNCSSVDL
jgi:hypothetical protein